MLGHIVMILWIEVSDFAVWEIPSIKYKKMRKVYNASTVNQGKGSKSIACKNSIHVVIIRCEVTGRQ